jgi:FMN phosphatase YigB (HAD superfamily)
MIGDRIDNDIIPAKKLGFHTIWIKQGFILREDVNYRNIGLRELVRIDT